MTFPPPLKDELRKDPRALLRAFNLRPKKSLGQNFLVSPSGIETVVRAADLTGDEDVLEIGAGLGTLSLALAERARYLLAIEIDEDLLPALRWVLSNLENVRLLSGDILNLDLAQLGLQPDYVVVANIPYNITSHLIRKLMESDFPAQRVILTIQEEVANRIVAEPGGMSLLALSVQVYGVPRVEAKIAAAAFTPQPAVNSAVIRIDRLSRPRLAADKRSAFFELARAGFGQRRKQLPNALSHGLGLKKAHVIELLEAVGISPRSRAQELSLDEWISLTDHYLSKVKPG
jgi:16S rRNA (adenine1518-N6/adenine1519-N6)-dimethyltransferase